jgi:hypothetical protein
MRHSSCPQVQGTTVPRRASIQKTRLGNGICVFLSAFVLTWAAPCRAQDWTQDAHDAQRTGATAEEPVEPWTFLWSFNGPDAQGGIGNHFYDAPREGRTVMGPSAIIIPAGAQGLFALAKASGAQMWNLRATAFNAAPAYDASGFVFAGGSNGTLYKIDAALGTVSGTYAAGSGLNKAVLLVGNSVYVVSDDGRLHNVNKSTMTAAWVYAGGSTGATPPSYSSSRNILIYATDDLFVHAVNNTDGSRKWRVKPSPNNPGDPAVTVTQTVSGTSVGSQFDLGWPVVAEQHGVVLLRLQLPHDFMASYPSTGHIFPTDLATTRAWLQANPQYKNLFVLNLDDGTEKFVAAVGYGSTEDTISTRTEGYGVMGSQPVVKAWPSGPEVVYIHFRNGQSNPPDYRWDGHMGEMVLDSTTIAGFAPGDLRFVKMTRDQGSVGYVRIIDEQNPITMAGSSLFHSHWAAMESVKITDRSSTLGLAYATPINTSKHPVMMRSLKNCTNQNNTTHWTTCTNLSYVTDGDRFYDGPGWWGYWNVADPPSWRVGSGNTAGTQYSAGFQPRYTYVSAGYIVMQDNGGAVYVFRHSGPTNVPAPPTGVRIVP